MTQPSTCQHEFDYENETMQHVKGSKHEYHTPCKKCGYVEVSETWKTQ